jgi:acetolactate synthase-1/2/3 large subunit
LKVLYVSGIDCPEGDANKIASAEGTFVYPICFRRRMQMAKKVKTVTGGQLAVDALVARGVEHVFFISGGHINPIHEGLDRSSVQLISTRHEQAAVFMAEAMGRMTRRPGVAMVTAGPGFTNALTPIANARLANSPLLLIAGVVGLKSCEKLDLQDMVQLPVIEPMVKKALICHNAERVGEFVDMAYRTCISGRPGPVYLELPVDVLNTAVNVQDVRMPHTVTESRVVDPVKAKAMIEMLGNSRKPIVIAGSGAYYSDAGEEFAEFIEKTGAPGFTATMGRGIISDTHPLCFESSLIIRPGSSSYAMVNADLIILLGNRISMYYACGDIFNPEARIVQVDILAEEIGRNHSIDLPVVGDIRELLRACNRIIEEEKIGEVLRERFKEWISELTEEGEKSRGLARLQSESSNVPIHPARLAKEINDFMDREDDIVVSDGGDTQVWMGMERTVRRGGHYLDSGIYGCLGVGLPYAFAAKLLYPQKRVLNVIGDGSVGFNFMEFETSIRKGVPLVVVINNDQGWGMIRHSQMIKLGHAIEEGTEIGIVHYQKMVEALGGRGLYVDKPEEIRPALEEAFKSGETTCINVMTDPAVVSPGSLALAMVSGYEIDFGAE